MATPVNTSIAHVFSLRDGSDNPIPGVTSDDFATLTAFLATTPATTATVTITDLGVGLIRATFTASVVGAWVLHAVYADPPLFVEVAESFDVVTAAQFDPVAAIGATTLTVVSPVALDGDVEIVRGDDYAVADDRALTWTTTSAGQWPDLTGATILLAAVHRQDSGQTLRIAGSVVTPTGATKSVRVELADTDTNALRVGAYDFDVQAIDAAGHVITLVTGELTMRQGYA